MELTALRLVADALLAAWEGWESMLFHTDNLLNSAEVLFDRDKHDTLLFDDEAYSGSRKYLWLINSLHTFDTMITATDDAWETYHTRFVEPAIQSRSWLLHPDRELLISGVRDTRRVIQDLQHIQKQFRNQREKTVALRDGVGGVLIKSIFC